MLVRAIAVFPVFRLLTDFVCLLTYEFSLSLWKIARCSVILLLPFICIEYTSVWVRTLLVIGTDCIDFYQILTAFNKVNKIALEVAHGNWKKVKNIYKLVFDRGDSFNQMNHNYRLCTPKYHVIATTVALNLNTTLHQNIIPICQKHKALFYGICCLLVLNDRWWELVIRFDFDFDFWCLTPLSAIFQLYHGDQF